MKLKEIHRTSTFAWSPTSSLPLLATGTVAGALDESFSNESQLEIWAPDFLDKNEFDLGGEGRVGPKGIVADNSRCVCALYSYCLHFFDLVVFVDSIVSLGDMLTIFARAV